MQLNVSASAHPNQNLRVCVVLPVQSSSAGLAASLAALAAQKSLNGADFDPTRYEVLLLASQRDAGCAELARAFAARHPRLRLHVAELQFPPALAGIGHARRLLMDLACRRLGATGNADGWIASTDAETVVAPDWLAHNERELAAGAHAVGGRILFDPGCAVEARSLRRRRLDAAFCLARSRLEALLDPDPADPWPRHHQHVCASLALTRRAYLQLGRLPAGVGLEDQTLVDRLRRRDLCIRHSPSVRVTTSSRRIGHAELGMPWPPRPWLHGDTPALAWKVERVDHWLKRVLDRRELRLLWQTSTGLGSDRKRALKSRWSDLALRLSVPLQWLISRSAAARFFGALWAEVQARQAHGRPASSVAVRDATRQIRALVASHLAADRPAITAIG